MIDRNTLVKEQFIHSVLQQTLPARHCQLTPEQVGLTSFDVIDIFESMVMSRHLDLQSRVMQKQGNSFYTIGSSGHEGNAAYAKAFHPTDMAFLHYRSGAFAIQRGKQVDGETSLYDMLLSFAAAADDPMSGGRHKVLGSKALNIPPQTSTIASHIPKAVGTAFSIPLAGRINHDSPLPHDSVVVCNFGDASANHSTAQGAFNAAAWAAYQSVPLPIVFICEDNGIGISTSTPNGWIAASFKQRPNIEYIYCDGLNVLDTYHKATQAIHIARTLQRPVFLHMRTVRLLGHAGSDAEFVYRDIASIEAAEKQDPLLHTAAILLDHDILPADDIIAIYENIEQRVLAISEQIVNKAKLANANAVKSSIIPTKILPCSAKPLTNDGRSALFKHEKHNLNKKQHLAKLINWTLLDLMAQYSSIVMCGEDIGKKGGVYNVTTKLCERFGKNRVINTLLDEQSILGLAIGLAHNGFLPIPEIQFLAYVHNAEDQIRGEAATLPFFSTGQFTNPMVIRIAGLAYQKGFGGHFHNDNSFAVFRDIPGLIIACPSNGADAIAMLRQSVKVAQEQQRVVIFLEPIALYMTRDLVEKGDDLWAFDYTEPKDNQPIAVGDIGVYGSGEHIMIISYGNGYYLSRQAEIELSNKGIFCTVVDLRWLAPLNTEAVNSLASKFERVIVVDECRQTASISEAIVTSLTEHCQNSNSHLPRIARICAEDSFIPLGSAAYHVLPACSEVVSCAINLMSPQANISPLKR